MAASIVACLYRKIGSELLLGCNNISQGSDRGWILSCLPLCEEITKIVEDSGCADCKRVYWENVKIFGVKIDKVAWVNSCIQSLIDYNRAYSVIGYFAYTDWNDSETIVRALTAALTQYPTPESSGLQLSDVGNNAIESFFEKLYQTAVVPDLDVAKLELAYLKGFDIEFEPQCLMRQLLSSPELYFELLTSAYLSDNEDVRELTEQQRRFANIAYSALDRIHRIPGSSNETKVVDESAFRDWVSKTSQLAKENCYLNAHDCVLGTILSYSPIGQDGSWPAECVRSVFEEPHSESLETHFIIGKENQRGVYNVTAGVEEERIAEDYRRQADALQLLYPRTAAILLRLSGNYHAEAKKERERELKGF